MSLIELWKSSANLSFLPWTVNTSTQFAQQRGAFFFSHWKFSEAKDGADRWWKFLKFWWLIRLLYFVCSGFCEAQRWGKSVPGLSPTFSPCTGVESWYGPNPHAPDAPWVEVGQLWEGSHRFVRIIWNPSLLSYKWERKEK